MNTFLILRELAKWYRDAADFGIGGDRAALLNRAEYLDCLADEEEAGDEPEIRTLH